MLKIVSEYIKWFTEDFSECYLHKQTAAVVLEYSHLHFSSIYSKSDCRLPEIEQVYSQYVELQNPQQRLKLTTQYHLKYIVCSSRFTFVSKHRRDWWVAWQIQFTCTNSDYADIWAVQTTLTDTEHRQITDTEILHFLHISKFWVHTVAVSIQLLLCPVQGAFGKLLSTNRRQRPMLERTYFPDVHNVWDESYRSKCVSMSLTTVNEDPHHYSNSQHAGITLLQH